MAVEGGSPVPGQPTAVRAPVGVFDVAVRRPVNQQVCPVLQVVQPEFVAVVCDCHHVHRRVDVQIHGPAEGELLVQVRLGRLAARCEHLETLFAHGIGYGHDALAVPQPGRQAIAHALGCPQLQNPAGMVSECKSLAARRQRNRMALRMQIGRLEMPGRLCELAVALHPRRGPGHVYLHGGVVQDVQQVEVGSRMVGNDGPAVAVQAPGWITRVEVGMVGVPGEIFSGRQATVDVPAAFMVADQEYAFVGQALVSPNPHGRGQVAVQIGKNAVELLACPGGYPQPAGRAAPISLPTGRIAGVAAQHHRAVGSEPDG